MVKNRTKDAVKLQLEALRKEQILDAASLVFAKKGFRTATMQQVASAANIANGTVYNYFRSKDDLLLALLDRLNETQERPAQFQKLQTGDAAASLVALMRHRYQVMARNKELLRALLPEMISTSKVRKRYLERVVRPTEKLAEAALASLGASDPVHLMRAMAASLLGVVVLDLLGDIRSQADSDRVVALLGDAFSPFVSTPVKDR